MQLNIDWRYEFPRSEKQPVRIPKCDKAAAKRRKKIEEIQEKRKLKKLLSL